MNVRYSIAHMSVVALALIASSASAEINAPGYRVQQLVKPSAFHGIHGLAFDAQDRLYAGSVVGQSVYRVDTRTGAVETIVGPHEGMADDLVFLSDGTMVWTAISQDTVRARKGNGPIRVLAEKLNSVNSINYRKSDGRLFVAQVFGGDGLWELYPSGDKPPRNILKDIGGLNGFDIGPDGWIYGPLWFKKQVVKINPDTGELKVVADGFHTPAAANFDSKFNLYVLDTALGTVNHVDIKTGAKRVVAKLETSLDNLAIDSKDRVFVSNMADNGIQEVDVRTGKARQVVKGSLAIPVSIAAVSDGKRDLLYVADIFALRAVDGETGKVTDIERSHAAGVHIEYATGVSANDKRALVLTGGEVLKYARRGASLSLLEEKERVRASQAVELADGRLLVVQRDELAVIAVNGERKVLASKLGRIQGVAVHAGDAYLTDAGEGRVLRVSLSGGQPQVVASGLTLPQSIAATASGQLLVVEFGKKRIVSVDRASGNVTELASNLPIGMRGGDRLGVGIGLTVGPSGAIYVTSDVENSIYKLTKM